MAEILSGVCSVIITITLLSVDTSQVHTQLRLIFVVVVSKDNVKNMMMNIVGAPKLANLNGGSSPMG